MKKPRRDNSKWRREAEEGHDGNGDNRERSDASDDGDEEWREWKNNKFERESWKDCFEDQDDVTIPHG